MGMEGGSKQDIIGKCNSEFDVKVICHMTECCFYWSVAVNWFFSAC